MFRLLTTDTYKTNKSEKHGYKTAILLLSPADESGITNVCPYARTCKSVCLNTAGQNVFSQSRLARFRRTQLLVDDRKAFLTMLGFEIEHFMRICDKKRMAAVFRPNGLSDLPWLGEWASESFHDLIVYDYTKIPQPWKRVRRNYSVVFSYDGTNKAQALACLRRNHNVAVVFKTQSKTAALPYTFWGVPVIDGDDHDLRFLDPAGVVVGLRAKGAARTQPNKFVVEV